MTTPDATPIYERPATSEWTTIDAEAGNNYAYGSAILAKQIKITDKDRPQQSAQADTVAFLPLVENGREFTKYVYGVDLALTNGSGQTINLGPIGMIGPDESGTWNVRLGDEVVELQLDGQTLKYRKIKK